MPLIFPKMFVLRNGYKGTGEENVFFLQSPDQN